MKIEKAFEITDAKIAFVSLVDKAANKKQFLITKAGEGSAQFQTYGRIIKVDEGSHYVTGIVYEPLVEDAHGNFMTEEEIRKAAYWFAKNGDKVDVQHSFEAFADAAVVENWIEKADTVIGSETVTEGTWLMTVEVTDPNVWEKIQKGELTGFSMGGVGKYSEQDVDPSIEKGVKTGIMAAPDNTAEKKGIFKKLAETFGFDVVEKDENQPVIMAGKKISARNKAKLDEICQALDSFTKEFELEETEEEEETEVKKEDIQKMVDEAVEKAVAKAAPEAAPDPVTASAAAVAASASEPEITPADVQKMVDEAVQKAIAPVLESHGLPQNLNDGGAPVKKARHYLSGIL